MKRRRTKSTPRRPSARKRSRRRAPDSPSLSVVPLGTVRAIEYVHCDDGTTYRHRFKGSAAKLYHSTDGRTLVVAPIRITGRFIGN